MEKTRSFSTHDVLFCVYDRKYCPNPEDKCRLQLYRVDAIPYEEVLESIEGVTVEELVSDIETSIPNEITHPTVKPYGMVSIGWIVGSVERIMSQTNALEKSTATQVHRPDPEDIQQNLEKVAALREAMNAKEPRRET
jgi:hypothetical protein